MCEKAYLLTELGRREEALTHYQRKASARLWITDSAKARALRGQGRILIDLGRLDEAEEAFKQSLSLEAGNEMATEELAFIEKLQQMQPAHLFNPRWTKPANQTTLNTLKRIEQLPAEPAPPKVGPNNFSLLLQAYLNGGWEAFEREFDQLFTQRQKDYTFIKEQVLRDPMFHPVARRNQRRLIIARLVKGEEGFEKEFNTIYDNAEKPRQDNFSPLPAKHSDVNFDARTGDDTESTISEKQDVEEWFGFVFLANIFFALFPYSDQGGGSIASYVGSYLRDARISCACSLACKPDRLYPKKARTKTD